MTDEQFDIESARTAEREGRLGEWVRSFLGSDGSDNAELGEMLRDDVRLWFGPIEIPFDILHRLAGPESQPTLERLDEDDIDTVESMGESIEEGWDPPPFVATWADDHFTLEDGNHRVEGLRRSGRDRYWCVVGADDEDQKRAALAAIN